MITKSLLPALALTAMTLVPAADSEARWSAGPVTPNLTPMPDLRIERASVERFFGRAWYIKVKIRNVGPGHAGRFITRIDAWGSSVQEEILNSVAAGEARWVYFEIPPFSGNVWTIRVDHDNDVREWAEYNNSLQIAA